MDNVFSDILGRAAAVLGSRSALGALLRVPESTLERWMEGRSHMPLRAFAAVLDLLAQAEPAGAVPASAPGAQLFRFNIGALFARCSGCGHALFLALTPARPLPLESELACQACGERVVHRALLERLAREAIAHRRAMPAAGRAPKTNYLGASEAA